MDILIVDESSALADMLRSLLSQAGHHVRTMTSAQATAEGVAPCDACVVDLDVNRANGSPLLRRLREQGRSPRTVGWTAADELWRPTQDAKGFDAFLAKPASFAMLLAAIEGRSCPVCAASIDAEHRHADCRFAGA